MASYCKQLWAINRYIAQQGWQGSADSTKLLSNKSMISIIKSRDLRGYEVCAKSLSNGGQVKARFRKTFLSSYFALRGLSASKTGEYVTISGVVESANKYINGSFLNSPEWRRVRLMVLKRDGARCACCGASPSDGERMTVDHIKPRRLFPELALDMGNLQVLCWPCNEGKGNWDQTDWR